jgi:hypothetical protein
MSNYRQRHRGVLFKNSRKKKESHPDYAGSITIDGTEYWLNAWVKDGKENKSKFLSLSAEPKTERLRGYTAEDWRVSDKPDRIFDDPAEPDGDLNDSIPF